MNILFLTDNFPPETNAPANRTYEHAREWVSDGHNVTVITCTPNFPAGEVFDGYRNAWYQVETMDGIRVVRVKSYITANEGFVKRTLDYMSFMVTGTIAGLLQKSPDIVVATSPQFFCAVAGYLTAALKRKPFIFELRDLWPASITAVGAMKKSRVITALEKLEMFLYRKATAIVAVTNSFRDELIARGVDKSKIFVVRNGVDLTRYKVQAKDKALSAELGLTDQFVVGYIGTHGMAHALPKVLEAAINLKDRPDIVFMLVGNGAEKAKLEQIVRSKNLDNVKLLPHQPKNLIPRYWSLCDVALIPLKNHPVFSSVIPSKLFECMGMGIPVVMSLPGGEATDIVDSTACGVTISPESPADLVETVLAMASEPQQLQQYRANAVAAAPQFSRRTLAAEMLSILTLNQ